MVYIVQEFVAGRWYVVRSFDTKRMAEHFVAFLGRKARIITR